MWILVHEDKAWQITSEDPTGMWGEDYVWVDIGDNPDGIQEGWIANSVRGEWEFSPYQPPLHIQIEVNRTEYERLINKASVELTPLLVSLQLGNATNAETTSAQAWQKYYRELRAIDLTSVDIVWPNPPASI